MIDYESINRDLTDRAPGWVAAKPIRSKADYCEAVEEIQRLSGATEDSRQDDLLAVLSRPLGHGAIRAGGAVVQ